MLHAWLKTKTRVVLIMTYNFVVRTYMQRKIQPDFRNTTMHDAATTAVVCASAARFDIGRDAENET